MKKSLLRKGLNFAIPPKTLEYSDYLLLSYSDIAKDKKEVLKTKIKDCTFSLFKSSRYMFMLEGFWYLFKLKKSKFDLPTLRVNLLAFSQVGTFFRALFSYCSSFE